MQNHPRTAVWLMEAVRWVEAVYFLHWHLIKCPFGGRAAEEDTQSKFLSMAAENWEQAPHRPFQPPNNTTAKTETQVSFQIL